LAERGRDALMEDLVRDSREGLERLTPPERSGG
jgi:hypothetical protein